MADISPDAQKALETLAQLHPELAQFIKNTKKLNESLADELKQKDKWEKALNSHLKQLNEASGSGLGKFINALKTGDAKMEKHKATLDALDKAIESLTDSTDDATNGAHRLELQQKRQQLESKIALSEFNAKVINTGKVLTTNLTSNLASAVTKTTGDFAKGLQNGSDANQLSANLLTSAVDAAASGAGAMTGALQSTGSVMQNSTNPKLRMLGTVAEGAGTALGFVAQGASKLAKFGIEVLSKEVEKTVNAFNATSSAGAMFADGMTGMRNAAGEAGLTLDQFSKVITSNTDNLAALGMGVTEGTKRISGALKAGGDSMKDQMLKLGYSFEEQAGLVAETMKDMRGSGGPLKASNAEVAQQTMKYAENLRVISGITGEDAKKKMAQVREQANQLAFQQKLAGMDEGQRKNVVNAMANMSDMQRKNFMDMVNFGSVINKEGAAAASMSGGLTDSVTAAYNAMQQGKLDEIEMRKIQGQYGEQMKKDIISNTAIGAAGAAGVGGLAGQLADSLGQELQFRNKFTPEAIAAAEEAAKKQKTANDDLTNGVVSAAKAAQDLKVQIETLLTPMVAKYAEATGAILESLKKIVNEVSGSMAEAGESFWDATKRIGGAALSGAATGAAIGGPALAGVGTVALPGAGTVAGGTVGVAGGAIIGGLVGAIKEAFWGEPGKAKGGISTGPESGYMEKLHGAEAVVPLEGGRSIPVSMNFGDIMPKTMTALMSKYGNENKDLNFEKAIQDALSDTSKLKSDITSGKTIANFGAADVGGQVGKLSALLSQESLIKNKSDDFNKSNITSAFKSFGDISNKINANFENQISPVNTINDTAATIDFSGITNMVKDVFSNFKQEKPSKTEETTATLYSDKAVKSTADSDLTNIVKEQIRILSEIKDTLNSSRDLQQQYVYNTYT